MATQQIRSQLHRQLLKAQDWSQLERSIDQVEAAFNRGHIDTATAADLAAVSIQLSRHLPQQQPVDRLAA